MHSLSEGTCLAGRGEDLDGCTQMGGPIALATLDAIPFLSQFIHFILTFIFISTCTQICESSHYLGAQFSICPNLFTFSPSSQTSDFSHFRIFYSSGQSLNQSCANSQDFTNPPSKEQYYFALQILIYGGIH